MQKGVASLRESALGFDRVDSHDGRSYEMIAEYMIVLRTAKNHRIKSMGPVTRQCDRRETEFGRGYTDNGVPQKLLG